MSVHLQEQIISFADLITGTATAGNADADSASGANTARGIIVYGAVGWFEATQVAIDATLTIHYDPGDTNTLIAGILMELAANAHGVINLPTPVIIPGGSGETILCRARLSSGGTAIVGRVALYSKQM